MKIKIVGDGSLHGTKVVDAETGKTLEGVTYVSWSLGMESREATVLLVVNTVPIEIEAKLRQVIAKFPSIAWFRFFIKIAFKRKKYAR